MGTDEQRLPASTLAALCVTEFCCLGALMGPIFVGLSMRVSEVVADPAATAESDLRWVLALGALAAMVSNPSFGWLSDRTLPRLGHRVPWIVGGAVVGVAALYLAATATTLAVLILGWVGAQIAYNATFAGLYAALSDIVPAADRSRVSGWFAAAASSSLVFGVGIFQWAPQWPVFLFVAMGLAALPVVAVAGWHLSRTPLAAKPDVEVNRERVAAPYWWLWGQRLVAQSAYGFVSVFGVLFLMRRAGLGVDDAVSMAAIGYAASAAVGVLGAALLAHRLARRIGFRPVLAAGMGLLVVGNAVMAFATSSPMFLVAVIVAGLGLWMFSALDLAAALAVVPHGSQGRYLGFFNIARTLPQALVPFVSPWLLAIGSADLVGVDRSQNYFAMLAFGTAMALVALILLPRLTLPDRDGVVRDEPVTVR